MIVACGEDDDARMAPFKGDIAEVIFYTGSLSDADMKATENYLGPKYGLFVAPPTAPTGLTATAVDHQRIDLAWMDNATNEEGFRIERREGQTGTFGVIAIVMANVTTYSDSSLVAETEFCYRVVATNTGGDSNPSNVACATTGPAPPTDVTPVATQTNQIDLTWADNSLTEQGFRIERREGQTGAFLEIASVSRGVTTYRDQSVVPSSEYCYRVAAFSGAASSYSSTGCTTTPSLTPVECTTDPQDNRSVLVEILTSPDHLDWRTAVGLSNPDPNQLVLVTDNAVCQALWSAVYSVNPDASSLIAFFKLGSLYIVTNYINTDPSFGPIATGLGITSVVDEEFNVINPSLAH